MTGAYDERQAQFGFMPAMPPAEPEADYDDVTGRVILPWQPGVEDTLVGYPLPVRTGISAWTPPTEGTAYIEWNGRLPPRPSHGACKGGDATSCARGRHAATMAAQKSIAQLCRSAVGRAVRAGRLPPDTAVFRNTALRMSTLISLPQIAIQHETPPRTGFVPFKTPPDTDNLEKTLRDALEGNLVIKGRGKPCGWIVDDDGRITAGPPCKHHVNDDYPIGVKVWLRPWKLDSFGRVI